MTDVAETPNKPRLLPPPRTARRSMRATPVLVRGPRRWPMLLTFMLLASTAGAVVVLLPAWASSRTSGAAGATASGGTAADRAAFAVAEAKAGSQETEPAAIPIPFTSQTPSPKAEVKVMVAKVEEQDPEPPIARKQKSEVTPFVAAISEGLAALERRDFDTARAKFKEADRIHPGATQVADGLAQAKMGIRLQTIAKLKEQARQFESKEMWGQAAGAYQRVLELDPAIEFANQGKQTADLNASFYASLEKLLVQPARFSDDAVREEATLLQLRARHLKGAGPRLKSGLERIQAQLKIYGQTREVVLNSDEMTNIIIYRVKRFTPFLQRRLDLRPATYTVVGSRKGYRDVRLKLVVEPGGDPEPLTIKCLEKI